MTTKAFENSDKNAPLLVAYIGPFGCVSANDTFSSVNTELKTDERNVKTLVSLGENGVLHFSNGIRTNTDSFQTALLNKNINEIWKSVVGAF